MRLDIVATARMDTTNAAAPAEGLAFERFRMGLVSLFDELHY
jgi:hypothetical protein